MSITNVFPVVKIGAKMRLVSYSSAGLWKGCPVEAVVVLLPNRILVVVVCAVHW